MLVAWHSQQGLLAVTKSVPFDAVSSTLTEYGHVYSGYLKASVRPSVQLRAATLSALGMSTATLLGAGVVHVRNARPGASE